MTAEEYQGWLEQNIPGVLRGVVRPVFYLANNFISLSGIVLTTTTAFTLITFFLLELFGFEAHPYVGIIAFVILPGLFVFGLLLIPAGMWLRRRKHIKQGVLPKEYPRIDLNEPRLRQTMFFVSVATFLNVIIFFTATYRGVKFMDSTEFCGLTCHKVMQPEYTAYRSSPHARVECVNCHIGPGASWFVRSKLSGTYQVIAVTFNLYPRPIPTPVRNLRPARETCEQCHWPEKFAGDKLVIKTKFADDEANTQTKTVLLMKIGGVDRETGKAIGIHGIHLDARGRVQYVSGDAQRQNMIWVGYREDSGQTTEFLPADGPPTPAQLAKGERRVMDCMDCHNRPTHIYRMPGPAVDEAMAARLIDPSLPYIKKTAVEALTGDYRSSEVAAQAVRNKIEEFYRVSYPAVWKSKRVAIDATANALVAIYQRNVFPQMKINWGTYPNNLGHEQAPGCFRCHDGTHQSKDGRTIQADCNTCHQILAMDDPNPKILSDLFGSGNP